MCECFKDVELKIKILNPNAKVPHKREEDSGYDIYGIIEDDYIVLAPGENVIIGTGIAMEFPKGLGFIIGNRGSVGTKCAIVGAHVIDSGYRGEIKIDLHNISGRFILITDMKIEDILQSVNPTMDFLHNSQVFLNKIPIIIPKSSALCQGLIVPTLHLSVKIVDELSNSERKENAFGSTNNII